jgi:hypothetical protein
VPFLFFGVILIESNPSFSCVVDGILLGGLGFLVFVLMFLSLLCYRSSPLVPLLVNQTPAFLIYCVANGVKLASGLFHVLHLFLVLLLSFGAA